MALIKNRKLSEDTWRVLLADAAVPVAGDVVVALPVWKERREELIGRQGRTGVWLDSSDEPGEIGDLPPLIAVNFPAFTDGRGYSTARLLRQRYRFTGELRAIGDVLRDQLYELERCGFDSFLLRRDQDAADALRAFNDFSNAYQAAVDQGALFERRFRAERSAA